MFLILYVLFGSCLPLLFPIVSLPSKKCLSQSPQVFHISSKASSLLFGPVRPIESGADVAVNVERVGHSQQHNALCVDGLFVVFLLEVSLVLLHSPAQALCLLLPRPYCPSVCVFAQIPAAGRGSDLPATIDRLVPSAY